jgi:hypothetical protein
MAMEGMALMVVVVEAQAGLAMAATAVLAAMAVLVVYCSATVAMAVTAL